MIYYLIIYSMVHTAKFGKSGSILKLLEAEKNKSGVIEVFGNFLAVFEISWQFCIFPGILAAFGIKCKN